MSKLWEYCVPNSAADDAPEHSYPAIFKRDGIIVVPQFASQVRTPSARNLAATPSWQPKGSCNPPV
jgi:hypothetical protein